MSKQNIFQQLLPHQKKTEKIVQKAHEKAEKIIQKAVVKADQILMRSNLFHKNLKDLVKIELKQAVERSVEIYQKELNSAIQKSLKDFSDLVQNELKASQDYLRKKTDEEWRKIEAELKTHKDEKIADVENRLNEKVTEIAQKIIGRALPAHVQEKYIFEALEKAKKEGIFDA